VERSLKLAHSVPNRDACGGCGGRQAPRYGSLLPPIYTPCKPPARKKNRIIRVTHGVCKHSRYSEDFLARARGFYLSLLERVFHVKILCLRAVISFRSSLLPIAFVTSGIRAPGFLI
jgi:hypothetical protein